MCPRGCAAWLSNEQTRWDHARWCAGRQVVLTMATCCRSAPFLRGGGETDGQGDGPIEIGRQLSRGRQRRARTSRQLDRVWRFGGGPWDLLDRGGVWRQGGGMTECGTADWLPGCLLTGVRGCRWCPWNGGRLGGCSASVSGERGGMEGGGGRAGGSGETWMLLTD